MKMRNRILASAFAARIPLSVLVLSLAPASGALASGFTVQSQSPGAIANGHAGVARADDASVALLNPALATRFDEAGWSVAVGGIALTADFDNRQSLSAVGTPATGPQRASADGAAPLLSLFHVRPLGERSALSMAVYTPFGLSTRYDRDWVGRYQVQQAELKTLAVSPALAFAPTEEISLSLGLSALHGRTKLVSAIDFGSVCFAAVGPQACSAAAILPQAQDGGAVIEADGSGFGWTASAAWQAHPRTRLGFLYRSKIDLDVSGDTRFRNPDLPGPFAALTQSPATSDGGVRSRLILPEIATIGAAINLNPRTQLIADVTWTRWSRLRDIRLRFDNGAADSVIPFDWQNTRKLGLGLNYRSSERWQWKGGVEWESSAVSDENRNAVVPDSDRFFVGAGLRYQLQERRSLDVALGAIRFSRSTIDRDIVGAGTLRGDYALDSLHLGVQYNWH
jgi:long-chain fatty acid transport protein